MGLPLHPEALRLQEELDTLLKTLKTNRDKVPLNVLKSKYRTGYENLCRNISSTATDYVKQILFHGLRIHEDYLEEILPAIRQAIQESGLVKELSNAAFKKQDIKEFTALALKLKSIIQETLESFYGKHTGLYITQECLDSPDILPEFYCFANGCIWHEGQWVPFEQIHPAIMQPQDHTSNLSQTV